MEIKKTIHKFSVFLNKSWEMVSFLLENRLYTSNESSINDWLQVNWELLVEKKILGMNEYLEVYGEGADFYGKSSRITDIEALPTHKIVVVIDEGFDILNKENIKGEEYNFEKLVGFKNDFYNDSPFFDCVLVLDKWGNERVFYIDKVSLKLIKLE